MNNNVNSTESFASKFAGWAVIGGIILTIAAVSIYFLLDGMRGVLKSRETRNWPQVQGEILRSSAVHKHIPGQDSNHWWDLKYEYQVDKRTYQGSRYAIDFETGSSLVFSLKDSTYDLAEEKYNAGDTVIVHYDPNDPQSAVLSTGTAVFTLIEFAAGILMTGGIVVILLRSAIARIEPS